MEALLNKLSGAVITWVFGSILLLFNVYFITRVTAIVDKKIKENNKDRDKRIDKLELDGDIKQKENKGNIDTAEKNIKRHVTGTINSEIRLLKTESEGEDNLIKQDIKRIKDDVVEIRRRIFNGTK